MNRLTFVTPPHPFDTQNLILLYFYFPMGYSNSAPYFLCTRNNIYDIANTSWRDCYTVTPHHLDMFAASSPAVADNAYTGVSSA